MGKMDTSKKILAVVLVLLYIFAILFSWGSYPGLRLWKRIDVFLITLIFNFTLFKFIHLVIGLSFFIYGIINVFSIIVINKNAQLERNKPKYIIMDSFYSKMRHPMYSMIIIIQVSLLFSLCSALGIVFSINFLLTFSFLGFYEEKYQLIPIFGNEYKNYM
ncbi:MAG: hypothetical protein ACFFKA_14765 [Candidatus Thorarchaeota archaeon]